MRLSRSPRASSLAATLVVAALVAVAGAARGAPSGALLVRVPVDAPGAARAERDVRAALQPSVRLLDAARTAALLEEARGFGLPCAELDATCATGFGQLVKVDEVITVEVVPLAGAWLARATRHETSQARGPLRLGGRLSTGADDGGQPLAAIAAGLYGAPASATVPVRIAVDPPDAVVRVDGRAAVRVDGIAWVLPGAHTFEATAAGGTSSAPLDVGRTGEIVDLSLVVAPSAPAVAAAPPSAGPPPAVAPAVAAGPGGPEAAEAAAEPDGVSALPLAVLVGGAALGVGGGALWGLMHVELGQELALAERGQKEGLGLVGVGLVAAGIATAGVGSALLLFED